MYIDALPAYGLEDTKLDDVHVQASEKVMRAVADVMRPGNLYIVQLFPFLQHIPAWLPGTDFQRVARRGRRLIDEMRFGTWGWLIRQYTEGKTRPSFFTRLMDAYYSKEIAIETVRDNCAVLNSGAYYALVSGTALKLGISQSRLTLRCPYF